MTILRSRLAGEAGSILILTLPRFVADESVAAIRDEVTARLPNADGAGLILDCSEVELINSIGITCLLQVDDHCRRLRAPMYLAGLSTTQAEFIRRLKLDKRFRHAATPEDAVALIDKRI